MIFYYHDSFQVVISPYGLQTPWPDVNYYFLALIMILAICCLVVKLVVISMSLFVLFFFFFFFYNIDRKTKSYIEVGATQK